MLVHDRKEVVKVPCERDGTQVDLWLARLGGSLNAQVTKHTPEKSPTLVRLDALYLVAETIIDFGFSEAIMPYAYAMSVNDAYMEPFETNVHAIVDHAMWPITIADGMAAAAQNMVGYFTGRVVTVKQMGNLETTDHGEVDSTVVVGDPWTETFELADDCVFCRKMTDQTVVDRVAGFQWAMDKEVASRFGAGIATYENPPTHYTHDDSDAERRAYHNLLKPWYTEHPMLLKVIPLIDLPLHLKRTLCIQWNHIVVEYLKVEPRFIYREEDGMYFWMKVPADTDLTTKRLIPSIKTRSNPTGATTVELMGDYFGPF